MKKIKKIFFFLDRKKIKTFFVIAFLMFVVATFEIFGIGIILPFLSILLDPNSINKIPVLNELVILVGNPDWIVLVKFSIIFLLVFFLIKFLVHTFLIFFLNNYTFKLSQKLSEKFLLFYLSQPLLFHLQRNSSELIANVQTNIRFYADWVLLPFLRLSSEILNLLGIVIVLIFINPYGSLLILSFGLLVAFLFYKYLKEKIKKWGEVRTESESKLIQSLRQSIGSIRESKILGREINFFNIFKYHNKVITKVLRNIEVVQEIPKQILEIVAIIIIMICIIFMANTGKISNSVIPLLGVYVAAIFKILPSVNRILVQIQKFRFGFPALDLLIEEYYLVSKNGDKNLISSDTKFKNNKKMEFKNKISVKNISFSYYKDKQKKVLENIFFEINKGETVGIIGESGTGKTTLINVILGLIEPNKGEILADDKNVRDDLRSWQNNFGFVPQTVYLTDDTIKKNIAFGLNEDEINNEKINLSIKNSQLEKVINDLPNGINTSVGERGFKLSGGQAQRVGIARALYNDPEILILDEATSSLDVNNEKKILESLLNLKRKKTLIIITHRLTTTKYCDKIYRMEDFIK